MSEILGYDIDGQPLRAGDRVVLLSADGVWASCFRASIGGIFTIKCKSIAYDDNVKVLESIAGVGDFSLSCGTLRKLPPKQDHEPGSWEEIAKLGWKPNLAPSTADC